MTTILLVDDSETQIANLANILCKYKYEVITASDGFKACKMAEELQPDVILMDVVMPNMDGFQATRQLSRNSKTQHIPVVLISGKGKKTDQMWGHRQGAQAYIVKPVDEKELASVIKSVCG